MIFNFNFFFFGEHGPSKFWKSQYGNKRALRTLGWGGGGRGVTPLFGLDGCAAEQGMAFRVLSVKQVTQFRHLASSDRKPLKGLRMSGPHLRQQQFFFLKSVVHDI